MMKNTAIRILTALLALTMLITALVSCKQKPLSTQEKTDAPSVSADPTEDIFRILASGDVSVVANGKVFDIYLPNETTILELRNYVEVAKGVSWMVASDISMQNDIVNKILTLNEGNNIFYVYCYTADERVSENYVLNIHRSGSYLVSFEGITETQTVVDGNFATQPISVPKKEGYTFAGWNFDFTKPITASVSVQAKWTPAKYVITYQPNLGSMVTTTQTVTYGEEVTLLVPVRDGFIFADWFNGEERVKSGVWTIPHNVTLTAAWASDSYTVTFDPNGGVMEGAKVISVEYGGAVTFPTPTREGYTFGGWYDGDTLCFVEDVYEYTKDLNLVAKWNERSATLVFAANGGIVSAETGKPSVELTLPFGSKLPTPIREGYTFGGWFSDEALTVRVDVVPDESMRLYAWWTEEGKPGEFIYEKSGLSYKVTARVDRDSGAVVPAYIGGKKTVDAIPRPNPDAGFLFENKNPQVKVDRTTVIPVTFTPLYEGDDLTLTFISADPSIATVDENGVVTGKKSGLCAITVENPASGLSAICVVIVESTAKDPNAGITVEPSSVTLCPNETVTLNATYIPEYTDDATELTFALLNGEGIVSLEEYTVTALAVGRATVSVSDNYGKTAIVSIEVVEPALTVEQTQITLTEGAEVNAGVTVRPATTVLVWTTDNDAVATVTDGVIKGVGIGECTVTVSTEDASLSATITVKVEAAPIVPSLTVDQTEITLTEGSEDTVVATVVPEDSVLVWKSDNEEIATVENGVIKGIATGECTVTVSTVDGTLSMTIAVKVEAAASVDPTPVDPEEQENGDDQLTPDAPTQAE